MVVGFATEALCIGLLGGIAATDARGPSSDLWIRSEAPPPGPAPARRPHPRAGRADGTPARTAGLGARGRPGRGTRMRRRRMGVSRLPGAPAGPRSGVGRTRHGGLLAVRVRPARPVRAGRGDRPARTRYAPCAGRSRSPPVPGCEACGSGYLGYLAWLFIRLGLSLGVIAVVNLFYSSPSNTVDNLLMGAAWLVVNGLAYPVLGCLDVALHLEIRMRTEGLDIALRRALRRGARRARLWRCLARQTR